MNSELLKKYKRVKYSKLIAAIIIDFVGFAASIIPVVGDSFDIGWAPISGVLIFMLFRNRPGMALIGAGEEFIPFTDFVPTAFITWNLNYTLNNKKTLSEFIKREVEEKRLIEEWTESK